VCGGVDAQYALDGILRGGADKVSDGWAGRGARLQVGAIGGRQVVPSYARALRGEMYGIGTYREEGRRTIDAP
jgi:hypothetical protein